MEARKKDVLCSGYIAYGEKIHSATQNKNVSHSEQNTHGKQSHSATSNDKSMVKKTEWSKEECRFLLKKNCTNQNLHVLMSYQITVGVQSG